MDLKSLIINYIILGLLN